MSYKTTIAALNSLLMTALLMSVSGCLLPATRPCKDVPPGEDGSCHDDETGDGEITADFGEFALPSGDLARLECGDLTFEGRCDGGLLTWCEDGRVQALDCARFDSRTCGWDQAAELHDCGN